MVRTLAVWLIPLALLSGCAAGPQWRPGPVVVITPTPAVTPDTTPEATASGPAVPAPGGAVDANTFTNADFASPSGRIWCSLDADEALCHFPKGMDAAAVPSPSEVCPDEGLDVTGVSVQDAAAYFCSGGTEALPQTNGLRVGWWKGKGLPSVTYDKQKLAVLPYGRKLAKGTHVCVSEKAGVTCGNTATGKGFRVALAGVTLIG